MAASEPRKVLILGASGMLGHALYRYIVDRGCIELLGTVRQNADFGLPMNSSARLVTNVNIEDYGRIEGLLDGFRPNIVVNCIAAGTDARLEHAISLNTLFPQRLASSVTQIGARLVHVSTDGVFSGKKGYYNESDTPDPKDTYGISKLLGEVKEENCLTLRTSIIGPELGIGRGLLEWFLRQRGEVKGFRNVVFSAISTFELSKIITNYILPRNDLSGIVNVSSEAISKFELLCLIASIYQLPVSVVPDDHRALDRSLDSSKFRLITGYVPPNWPEMIMQMREFS